LKIQRIFYTTVDGFFFDFTGIWRTIFFNNNRIPFKRHDEYASKEDRETSGTAKQDQRRNARASEEKK